MNILNINILNSERNIVKVENNLVNISVNFGSLKSDFPHPVKSTSENNSTFDTSKFRYRYLILKTVLNDSISGRSAMTGEEYTDGTICRLIGRDLNELRSYLKNDAPEPNQLFMECFVDTFGVNREWMLFGVGEYPFAVETDNTTPDPSVLLIDEWMNNYLNYFVVLGFYERRRYACVIRQLTAEKYEVFPKIFIQNSNVGATGSRFLGEFYLFLKEIYKRNKLLGIYMENPKSEGDFLKLITGEIEPWKYDSFEEIEQNPEVLYDTDRDSGIDNDFEKVKKIIHGLKVDLTDEDRYFLDKIVENRMKLKKLNSIMDESND